MSGAVAALGRCSELVARLRSRFARNPRVLRRGGSRLGHELKYRARVRHFCAQRDPIEVSILGLNQPAAR